MSTRHELIIFIKKNKPFSFGLALLVFCLILGFIISLFAPYDPRRWGIAPMSEPPSLKYFLGTTALGQDVFWLLSWSLRNSIIIGMLGSTIGLLIGVILGSLAAYRGGLLDKLTITIADTFQVIPHIMILILIASMLRGRLSVPLIGVFIGLLTWSAPVRNVRSMVLSLTEREFTYVAIFSGMSTTEILFRQYLSHIFPWISSAFINRIIMSMGTEITLAIFGLSSMDEATLGTMLYWSLKYQALFTGSWWWILAPVVSSIMLFISLYITSMGLSEYLNPRIRLR